MTGSILYAETDGAFVLRLTGDVRCTLGPTINKFLNDMVECRDFQSVVIDLSSAENIDSTTLGILAKLALRCESQFSQQPTTVSPRPDITRVLTTMGLRELMVIVDSLDVTSTTSGCVDVTVSEDVLRDQVIEAHRVLMSLNADNEDRFRDLVTALESEAAPSALSSGLGR